MHFFKPITSVIMDDCGDFEFLETLEIYTIQDFFVHLGLKPLMQLQEIIIFSLKHYILRPTKIIKDLCKASI